VNSSSEDGDRATDQHPVDRVDLEFEPLEHQKKRLFRITALLDGEVIHTDQVDADNANHRTRFLNRVAQRVPDSGVFDRDALDVGIQQRAREAENDNSAEADGQRQLSPQDVLDAFSIQILGLQPDQSILCWMSETAKRWTIKNPAKWLVEEMLLAIGHRATEWLCMHDDECNEGMFTPAELREAIALAASTAPFITETNLVGQGVWPDGDSLIIVNGADAHRFDRLGFEVIDQPRVGRKIIDFNADQRWCDDLLTIIPQINRELATSVFSEIEQVVDQWHWAHAWDARVATSLMFATFVQAAWTWRPRVAISGASTNGKTTLIQRVLIPLFGGRDGNFVVNFDNVTEAGLRQHMGHDAKPVVIDEFEDNPQRQRILELFRSSGRGGRIGRGTQDQQGREFRINHIGWFAAIETGGVWGQDANRILRLEMHPPQVRREPTVPAVAEMEAIREQVIATAVWAALDAVELADGLKSTQIPSVDPRVVESFCVPAAMYSIVHFGRDVDEDTARSVLEQMIDGRGELLDTGEPSELQLINAILSAKIHFGGSSERSPLNGERTIGQLLDAIRPSLRLIPEPGECPQLRPTLEAHGLRVLQDRHNGPARLFVAYVTVRDGLLRNTRWNDMRLDQLLLRIPGAEKTRQRCGGIRPHGVALPFGVEGLECLLDADDLENLSHDEP
jgi:hypothetical protein